MMTNLGDVVRNILETLVKIVKTEAESFVRVPHHHWLINLNMSAASLDQGHQLLIDAGHQVRGQVSVLLVVEVDHAIHHCHGTCVGTFIVY